MLRDPERGLRGPPFGRRPVEQGDSSASPPTHAGPVPLEPRGDRPVPLVFRQGAHPPFGIRWYGITSLFGHLRNFVARAIASESVDSRDWMLPNAPGELLAATCRVLGATRLSSSGGAHASGGENLVEILGRPVWVDFAADTGDDRDVSAGVARMLASTYDVSDGAGGRRQLPRGDMLVLGGDIAYPVATADEIYKRLVLPWNEQLREANARTAAGTKRVVLGVPGNHDWYDGLDGFGRLLRRRVDEPFRADDHDTTPRIGKRLQKRTGRRVGLVARQLHLDEVGGLYGLVVGFARAVRAFFRGVGIKRRRRLVLRGYEPVQEASYFALPLTAGLDMWGADRQLGRIDFRQRAFFSKVRRQRPDAAILFVSADPAMAYGLRNDPGARMLSACRLSLEHDSVFYISGDFHHYERRQVGPSMHVIAGGGGAFLHGTRIAPYPKESGSPAAVYPSGAACRGLVVQVPLKLAAGRAGWLVHLALALLASIELGAARGGALVATSVTLAVALGLALYFIAHQGHRRHVIALVAAPFGAALGLLPMFLQLALARLGDVARARGFASSSFLATLASDGGVLATAAFVGALLFGLYLTVLALLGLEHQQAFTVLGHPGFKHFVRLCIHPDGRIEAWTIGKDDVIAEGPPLLIDAFQWTPTKPEEGPRRRPSRRPSSG